MAIIYLLLIFTLSTMQAQNSNEKTLIVGLGQMHVEGGAPEVNLENAAALIGVAADSTCDIILLPECLDYGWTHSSAIEGAQPVPGPHSHLLQEAAKKYGIFVIAGLTERAGEKIFNTAVLISPDGKILGKHRKINILDIAQHIYSSGSTCSVVETDLGNIGVNICADNAPSTNTLGHALAVLGADVILSPCSWAVPPDYDNELKPYGDMWIESYTEIANRHQIPVIGVSNTGRVKDGAWKDWWCIGASLVVSKDGKVQTQLPYTKTGNELFVIELTL